MKKLIGFLFVAFLLITLSCSRNSYYGFRSDYPTGKHMIKAKKHNMIHTCYTYKSWNTWNKRYPERNLKK